jgi:hypothetical protein
MSVEMEMLIRDSSARFRASSKQQSRQRGTDSKAQFQSLEQSEYLRVRTIRIARASDLATRTHVFAGSA